MTSETPGDYLRRTLKDNDAMLEVARLATEDQREAMTHNTREWEEAFDENWRSTSSWNLYPHNSQPLKDFIHYQLQKAREEALERERQLKQVHMMELDAISCKSIEEFVVWRDQRKQRPSHFELDQDSGMPHPYANPEGVYGTGGQTKLDQDKQ